MDDQGAPHTKDCDICGERMMHLACLSARWRFPQQHAYKCSQCGFATLSPPKPAPPLGFA
jgi:predicted RNA-binding Zn-ribbon protein involved in translation (DUF1610 family)